MKKGQSLIEILIIFALFAAFITPLLLTIIASRDGKVQQARRFQASMILKETQEAIRIIRETGWSAIETPGTYHPTVNGSTWSLNAGSDIIGDFTRTVEISNVQRLNNQIVDSGGSPDPSTKKIETTISWNIPFSSSVSSTYYLTRYLENSVYEQTTQAEFDTGTHNNTITTLDYDGEVKLGAGGGGNWCDPSITLETLDLPKQGVANALTAIEGKAFAVTGDNASGVAFASIGITNDNPPIASIQGEFNGYKTNDVFGDENYGYIATDNNSEQIVIIDLSTMTKSGDFNGSGPTDAESIFVINDRGYMTQGSTFRVFDLSSKTGTRPELGSISLAGSGTAIVVAGNYAYVSIAGSGTKMQIVDISDPSNMSIPSSTTINGQSAQDISINDTATRAYVVTGGSSTQNEFFILDISSKSGSRPVVGSYDTNGMNPKAVTLVPGNKAIVVGHQAEEYQVLSITNESSPVRCGGLDLTTDINDIAGVLETDGDAFSYIITEDSSQEFRIIQGGPGGSYSATGYYESAYFDAGWTTAFNRIVPNYTEPPNTTVKFQIAIADAVSGSCPGANYVFTGPDGTNTTYYEVEDGIYFDDDGTGYENPGRCFKYRAYLETPDSNSTPIFEDITINYSP